MISAPPVIIVSVFSEWLELNDLGKLDTAAVNHVFRKKFLHCLCAYPSVKYDGFNHKLNSNMVLIWASVRKIRWLKLSLTNCDVLPKDLPLSCEQLTTLHLEDCNSLTDDILVSLLTCTPFLVDLKLCNCGMIGDASLLALVSDDCVPLQLKSLSIAHCASLSDAGLSAFADKHCRVLESFTVSHCNFSAAGGVSRVLESASSTLCKVSCDQCLELSDVENLLQSFVQLTSSYPVLLEEFTIAHRDLMSMSQAVSCVGAWMPHVSVLEVNLRTPLALSVVEELGRSQGSEDFQMVIKYIKGGVYPRPPKYIPHTSGQL
jgi:hypothetical protein